ncbi:uncharacterized protein LOC134693965 [Mytilus trossulus]|uniref:uncharacterized protein LOC134693965 n=1 Tax=Mytilus trossulus TaxID=6551 RepID=UPI003007C609
MVYNPPSGTGTRYPIVPVNGTLQARTDCGSNNFYKTVDDLKDSIITGDGEPRMAFAINSQIPGPSLIVYEGQQILIRVKNDLWMEGITFHWHGLPQKGTPYMDGVPRVTQCPINPGETFTYRFTAQPSGTFWYHSHLGTQRSDGLAGALIILENPSLQTKKRKEQPDAPEFVFLLSDWFPFGSATADKWAAWDINRFSDNLTGEKCFDVKRTYDYAEIGQRGIQTPVINAKGRRYEEDGSTYYPYIPLEMFVVKQGGRYRFRIISIAAMNAYRVSIDNHELKVVAVDGTEVEAEQAESVILHSAERIDVEIQSNAPVGNYWIRMEDMAAKDTNEKPINMVKGYGILRYSTASSDEPISLRTECTKDRPCRVINCLFGKFPEELNTYCVPMSSLKSSKSEIKNNPVPLPVSKNDFQEFFMNFHFTNLNNNPKAQSSINGIRMNLPASPLLVDSDSPDSSTSCDFQNCTSVCTCTHMLNLKLGNVIQFVLINYEPTGFGRAHPVHMHGHRFHVMKIGFPEYNTTTGNLTRMNPDIKCNTLECNRAEWADKLWNYGNVPGMNVDNPPIKDTIIVPWGGYVVIRIVADNPGYWYFHCHIELHNVDGMALVLQEGNRTQLHTLPDNFRTCGDFVLKDNEKVALFGDGLLTDSTDSTYTDKKGNTAEQNRTYIIALTVFLCISMVTNIILSSLLSSRGSFVTKQSYTAASEFTLNSEEKRHLIESRLSQ